jgi:hypothetical protein
MHVILVPHLALGLGSEKERRLLLMIVSKFLNHSAIRKQVRAENAEFWLDDITVIFKIADS